MNDNELKVLSEYRYYLSNIYNLFSLSKLMQYTSISSYTSVIYWLNDIWLGHSRVAARGSHQKPLCTSKSIYLFTIQKWITIICLQHLFTHTQPHIHRHTYRQSMNYKKWCKWQVSHANNVANINTVWVYIILHISEWLFI